MLFHKSQRALTVVATAAVLALAVILLATRGVIDALLMIVVVAVLAGAYLLRRYARGVLLYRRRSTPLSPLDDTTTGPTPTITTDPVAPSRIPEIVSDRS